jgi:hypothetical protein
VNKGTLGIHEVELVIHTSHDLADSSGVGLHANSALNLCKIATRNNSRRLVVDTALETSWAPIDKLNCPLGLDYSDGRVDILWYNITSVHEAASHVFSVARITLGHHVRWLKDRASNLLNGKLLMISLLRRNNWSVRSEHEVNARIWDEVGLELCNIDVESTVEP